MEITQAQWDRAIQEMQAVTDARRDGRKRLMTRLSEEEIKESLPFPDPKLTLVEVAALDEPPTCDSRSGLCE